MLGAGFVCTNPVLLLLLGLLGHAGADPVFIDLNSRLAEFCRWLGIRLDGRLRLFIDPVRFTVATPAELPDGRPFDVLFLAGCAELQQLLEELAAAPGLITEQTRLVVLNDRELFGVLQQHYRGQVVWASISSALEIASPVDAPNEISVSEIGTLHIAASPDDQVIHELVEILQNAGLAWSIDYADNDSAQNAGIPTAFAPTSAANPAYLLKLTPLI